LNYGRPGCLRVFLVAVSVLFFLWLLFHVVPLVILFLAGTE